MSLNLPDSFIDPSSEPTPAYIYSWPRMDGYPDTLSTLAQNLEEDQLVIRLFGFVEYEFPGKTMRLNFYYTKTPTSLTDMLHPNASPKTSVELITQGMWWNTGGISEYEVKQAEEKAT